MIPIGAYAPRHIMSTVHNAPIDAVRMFKDTVGLGGSSSSSSASSPCPVYIVFIAMAYASATKSSEGEPTQLVNRDQKSKLIAAMQESSRYALGHVEDGLGQNCRAAREACGRQERGRIERGGIRRHGVGRDEGLRRVEVKRANGYPLDVT